MIILPIEPERKNLKVRVHIGGQKDRSRSKRRSFESRSVSCSYVSNGKTSQRRDTKAIFPRVFEHPLKIT